LQTFGTWLKRFARLGLAVAMIAVAYGDAVAQTTKPPAESAADSATGLTSDQKPPSTKPADVATGNSTSTTEPAVNSERRQPPAATQTVGQSASSAEKPPAVVEEPPVYYVRDKQGHLIPLLGYSYEEISALIQQSKTGAKAQPAPEGFTLEQLDITGEVHESHADLTAQYKINLTQPDWVSCPLLKSGAVLRQEATFQGDAEHQVQFDYQSGAYSVRLRGTAGSQEQITLPLTVPIKTTGAQHQIQIDLPTATASRLQLQVPQSPIALTNHNGSAMVEAKPLGSDKNASQISLWGLGGALDLIWQEGAAAESSSAVLEATGQVLAQIDSHSVQFDALLTVRGFGAQFDKFHVQLPPGAQLSGGAPAGSGYTLTAVDSPTGSGETNATPRSSSANQTQAAQPKHSDSSAGTWVEVQLAHPTAEPVDVRIQAERAYDVTKPNTVLQLAGFEIREAATHRQWGHIAVVVVGDWQVSWGERDRMRQVAELPAALQRQGVVAGFEYFSQPASLMVRVAPRRTRISVEPEYVYFVDARQVRLEARLKFNIRGAKTTALDISMPGWEIDELGPAEVVDANAPLANHGATFAVPLLQPSGGEVELTFKAHRPLPADATHVELSLPTPVADVSGPAMVAIVPADNVRLRPRDDQLQGLVRAAMAAHLKLPASQQPALVYRAEQSQATFIADIDRLPQVINGGVQSNISLDTDSIHVEQHFNYHVQHDPAATLVFEMPQAFWANSQIQWTLDDQDLSATSVDPSSSDAKTVQVQLALPEARLGTFEIVAHYQVSMPLPGDLIGSLASPLTVPLVMPSLPSLDYNRALISGEAANRVQSLGDIWNVVETSADAKSDAQSPALRLNTSQAEGDLTLQWRPDAVHGLGNTVVQRAWVQSWVSGTAIRQDRAVYRFTTTADELNFAIPQGVAAGNLEVQIDHHPQEVSPGLNGSLKLKLPFVASDQAHVLELRYQWENPTNRSRSFAVELPRLLNNVWVQRLNWQLVLPRDVHLLMAPSELTPEYQWKWTGWCWSRQGDWDQAGLEKWTGASAADPLPDATNRYVFSTVGCPEQFSVITAGRWQIVLVGAAAALGIGLMLIYLPGRRRALPLMTAGLILLVLVAFVPDAALMFVQAAVLGCVLVLLARLLQYAISRRHHTIRVVPGSGSSVMERSSIQRRVRSMEMVEANGSSTEETVDLPVANSEAGVD
jgi:hypothetical protein